MDDSVTRRTALVSGSVIVAGISGCLSRATNSATEELSTEVETGTATGTELPEIEVTLAVRTVEATDVTDSTATLTGELTELEGTNSAVVAFEWREDAGGTWNQTATQVLGSTGRFNVEITGFDADATYQFRAVAAAEGETATGRTRSFATTVGVDLDVEAVEATEVTDSAATLLGELTQLDGADAAEVHFEWRKAGTDEWTKTVAEVHNSPGEFDGRISGLEPETDYEFRVVAATEETATTSDPRSIVTDSAVPVAIETVEATDVTHSNATFVAELTELDGVDAADVYFEWREVGTEAWATSDVETRESLGRFEHPISGLESETDYEFRAVAEADGRSAFGRVRTFTSDDVAVYSDPEPEIAVETVEATDVTDSAATLLGELTELDGADSAAVAFEWREAGAGEWSRTDTKRLDAPGTFDRPISELEHDNDYEFRAVAALDDVTEAGEVLAFVTEVDDEQEESETDEGSQEESETDEGSQEESETDEGDNADGTSIYWQVDFGEGEVPPDPPHYYPDDLVAALGNSADGVTENPSFRRQRTDGQLGDVRIEDEAFAFDDADAPTEVTVTFEVDEDGDERHLHLAGFVLPGPFTTDEIDEQERFEYASATYEGGDSGELTIPVPQ